MLSESALGRLKLHAYKPGAYSALDNAINPAWYALVEFVPRWMAPNLITLIGTSFLLSICVVIQMYDPYLNGDAPSFVYAWCAFCTLAYQTLDALDGKQARRTNTSSPLGQLFDHGCDALGSAPLALGLCSCLSLGPHESMAVAAPLIMATVHVPFYFAQIEERSGGALRTQVLGIAGVTEGQFLEAGCLLVTAWCGSSFWDQKATGFASIRDLIVGGGVVFPALLGLHSVWETLKRKPSALLEAIPLVVLECAFFGALTTDDDFFLIYSSYPIPVLMMFGVAYTRMVSELIVTSMVHAEFDRAQLKLIVPSGVAFLIGGSDEFKWVVVGSAILVEYLTYVYSTSVQIANYLGIDVLKIPCDVVAAAKTTTTNVKRGRSPARRRSPFTHVVMFQLNRNFTQKTLEKAKKRLDSFSAIPHVLDAKFGETFTQDRSQRYTHCLVVEFDRVDALGNYTTSSEHVEWATEFVRPFKVGDSLAVDFT